MTASFVHLNGPPAVGKSTIAAALVEMRPLSLCIEIDVLRTWFGQWARQEASKRLAREHAYTMVSAHLARGMDVVLPQLDAREEVLKNLFAIARECDARFSEVILIGEPAELTARVASPRLTAASHPRDLLPSGELARQIERYARELDRMSQNLPDAIRIDVTGLSPSEETEQVRLAIGW